MIAYEFIDFHTHAFPDNVAENAIPALEQEGDVKAFLDGRIESLIKSMDKAGVAKSVLCSIATKPSQFDAILNWSKNVRSEKIIPFPSIHPADPDCVARIAGIRAEGFKGIKMHPYYQNFFLDEKRMLPVYKKISEENLILVMHTGFDIAFSRIRRADPQQIISISEQFPELKLVTTHMGAWKLWEEVEEKIIGRPIYMDISYTLDFLKKEKARQMLLDHPGEYIIFGSDSPWAEQHSAIKKLLALDLGLDRERDILFNNAARLLNGD